MAAMRVVPPFDKFEDCQARLDLSFEMTAVKQFAFERGKETLAHGVVETVTHGTHRWPHARRLTALAKGQRTILAALVGVMNHGGGTTLAKGHVERLEH